MLVLRDSLGAIMRHRLLSHGKTPGPLRVDEGRVEELVLSPLLTGLLGHVSLRVALTSPPGCWCLRCKTLVKGLE